MSEFDITIFDTGTPENFYIWEFFYLDDILLSIIRDHYPNDRPDERDFILTNLKKISHLYKKKIAEDLTDNGLERVLHLGPRLYFRYDETLSFQDYVDELPTLETSADFTITFGSAKGTSLETLYLRAILAIHNGLRFELDKTFDSEGNWLSEDGSIYDVQIPDRILYDAGGDEVKVNECIKRVSFSFDEIKKIMLDDDFIYQPNAAFVNEVLSIITITSPEYELESRPMLMRCDPIALKV